MYKKTFLQPILLGLIALLFASCDKDFNELGTDIVGEDHFGFELDSMSTVKIFNQKVGPIASYNLPISPLGFYHNPAFGDVHANYVTQLELSTADPTFNNTDDTEYEHLPTIDSVVLNIPYFKKFVKDDPDTNVKDGKLYKLDSIYGEKPYDIATPTAVSSKFDLGVYVSRYFLRDLDPNLGLGESQAFYTDEDATIDANKDIKLNTSPDTRENTEFFFDKREHKLTTYEDFDTTNDPIYTRFEPSMRLHLRTDFFDQKILNGGSNLQTQAIFKNYLRGIYFKTTQTGGDGNMAMLNFKGGTITIYYQEDKITPDNVNTPNVNERKVERPHKSFALNMNGNCVSLLQHSNEDANYLVAANSSQEASKVYLKGGEGSMAIIDLFGTTDLIGYTENPNFNENLPISSTNVKYLENNIPNHISDEIDRIKLNGWLINEANLTFYIDRTAMKSTDAASPDYKKVVEPNRIYLYDLTNKKPIIDYTLDNATNGAYPKFNKPTFGGFLLNERGLLVKQIRDDNTSEISDKGFKYKVKITNYVRNLIRNDSTNVRLGLSVTENINSPALAKLRTPNSNSKYAPTMSVLNQLGTILYGTNIPQAPGEAWKRRLKLEIYYTKP
ncbi:DUF4270 domain-containing protein [Flavobacterium wongokense]|uniref:DUF4270 domain-containing protein n=1 Tax=Flavobacterium wongokense TaxID=2910674 RepID=UPI001F2170C1|nr:DUF4270 domain-containing protein [Flavobacterium sp. WG47]MCF6131746.1 DUF4270 domain-containing protein [Flavobacterium sp. WG47]